MATHHHHHHLDMDCSCHKTEVELDGEPPTEVETRRGVPFGEFLVGQRAIDRHQLLRALQMQDKNPGVLLGECLAALGAIARAELEGHLGSWQGSLPAGA